MAYDRYDSRDDQRGHRDDRQRGQRSGGQQEERGFFDRAIDSVSNFFSDDDSGERRDQGHGYNRTANNYDPRAGDRGPGYNRSGYEPRAYDENEGRQRRESEHDRSGYSDRSAFFGGGQSTSYGRGRDEGDYKNQYGRGGGESGGFGRGDYGRQGQEYYSRQGQDYGGLGSDRSYPSGYGQTGGGSYRESQHQSFGRDRDQDRQGGDRYRPMTGDYGRGSGGEGRQGSGFGGQDFGQQQYGSQDRFQDQGSDAGRRYNQGGWGDQDSRRQSGGQSESHLYGNPGLGGREEHAGSFGTSRQGQQSGFGGSQSSPRSPHDQHYSSWRQRQIEDLDRDYEEYCREHQSRFENEFSGFRQQRQTKRQMLGMIREHAEVVDESGQHVGTVDKVRGDKIILTKNDPEAHGVHRSFTCTLLDRVEDGKVYLSGSKESIRSRLTEEHDDDQNRSQGSSSGGGILGGLFGGSDRDDRQPQSSTNQPTGQTMSPTSTTGSSSEGPHVLDRSFSGTYDEDSSGGSSGSGRSTKK